MSATQDSDGTKKNTPGAGTSAGGLVGNSKSDYSGVTNAGGKAPIEGAGSVNLRLLEPDFVNILMEFTEGIQRELMSTSPSSTKVANGFRRATATCSAWVQNGGPCAGYVTLPDRTIKIDDRFLTRAERYLAALTMADIPQKFRGGVGDPVDKRGVIQWLQSCCTHIRCQHYSVWSLQEYFMGAMCMTLAWRALSDSGTPVTKQQLLYAMERAIELANMETQAATNQVAA
jgi:hypothetical protein